MNTNLADMTEEELRALIGLARRELAVRAGVEPPAPSTARTITRDTFIDDVYSVADHPRDPRWPNWAKWITKVDRTKVNGYAFEGRFIPEGTVELRLGRSRLILVCTTVGSRSSQISTYTVLKLDPRGDLWPTGLETTNATQGWALRLRDRTAALLAEIVTDA